MGVFLKGLPISIIDVTPGSVELSLSKTGQVINSFEGIWLDIPFMDQFLRGLNFANAYSEIFLAN